MNKLSSAQKIVRLFSSKKKFLAIVTESKQWGFTCSSCGEKSNIWEMGGVRYKAKGEPKIRVKCPSCSKIGVEKLVKSED